MKPRLSLSSLILIAMFVGILVGLFFGELVGWMEWIGQASILLMQMTILPFVTVSLISGIGRLEGKAARLLFSQAGVVMLLIWLLALIAIFILPIALPTVTTSAFFSTSVIEAVPPVNYFELYIPSNPFKSLAIGAIPAVVLFSIALGVAFITIEEKKAFLDMMAVVANGLSKVTSFMVKTLPVGVFCLAASAAGTLSVEEFSSLQVFLVAYFLLCLVLTFWIFPFIIACVTPFRYRDVLSVSRDALVTAFATGNIFIVLPVLGAGCKALFEKHQLKQEETNSTIDVLLPIAFTFPNAGKLTVIFFVLFAGWFVGKDVSALNYPMLGLSGLLSLFGSVYVAVPFMLDSVQLPSDLFQLFLVSSFITGKFNSLVAVMHLLIFTLLAAALVQKQWQLSTPNLVKAGGAIFGGLIAMVLVTSSTAHLLIDENRGSSEVLTRMKMQTVVSNQVQQRYPNLKSSPGPVATLSAIQKRGKLRVGYQPTNAPFSFFNQDNELVGFDIALITRFANDLGVEIDFLPYDPGRLDITLNQGHIDIAVSGIAVDARQMTKLFYSIPVMELHLSLVAKDYKLDDINHIEKLHELKSFRLALVGQERLLEQIAEDNPSWEVFALDSYPAFFEQPKDIYDALVISAEAGYAWTILYPDYGVVIPGGVDYKFPMAYAAARNNDNLIYYLNTWLNLKRTEGVIQSEFDYWILGQGSKSTEPRWSVLRDVLGWIE